MEFNKFGNTYEFIKDKTKIIEKKCYDSTGRKYICNSNGSTL